jgi:hypothetical protein
VRRRLTAVRKPVLVFTAIVLLSFGGLSAWSAYRLVLLDQLYDAVERGDPLAVRNALRRGADPNSSDPPGGPTPLMMAVEDDRCEVALDLIRHGARVDIVGKNGWTAADYVRSDDPRMAEVIREYWPRSAGPVKIHFLP